VQNKLIRSTRYTSNSTINSFISNYQSKTNQSKSSSSPRFVIDVVQLPEFRPERKPTSPTGEDSWSTVAPALFLVPVEGRKVLESKLSALPAFLRLTPDLAGNGLPDEGRHGNSRGRKNLGAYYEK
jgi:hypothetical protein